VIGAVFGATRNTRSGSFFQPIAHSPQRCEAFGAEFAAQVAHIDVDDVRLGIEVVTPDVAEELLAGEDLARMAEKRFRKGEFACRQVDDAVADGGLAGAEVELQSTVGQHGQISGPAVGQPNSHTGQKFLESERFGHVVVGPALEPGDGVLDAVASGEDDDRDLIAGVAQLAQHAEAIETGKSYVEDHQVEITGAGVVVGAQSVADDRNAESVGR